MSVRDNIDDGVYDDLLYPGRPAMPPVLRKKAYDLTKAERDELPSIVEKHSEAIAAYETAKKNYEDDRKLKHERFESDLATEHRIELHKHRRKVFAMAWEQGHSEGLGRVAEIYSDLVELLK